MFHLITTVMAIALVGIISMIGVQYLKTDTKYRDIYADMVEAALPKLEKAYDVATQANGGTAPAVTAAADGGFATNFLPFLKFTPALPPNMSITYGLYSGTNTRYTGLNYYCLQVSNPTEVHLKAAYKSSYRFSADQYFVSNTCGQASTVQNLNGSQPLKITFFVAYVPAVTP